MTVTQKAQTAPHNRLRTEARKRLPRARGAVRLSRPKTSVSGPAFSLPRISGFHGCDISFQVEINIPLGKYAQTLHSFSKMLHQHYRPFLSPTGREGMFEHILLK